MYLSKMHEFEDLYLQCMKLKNRPTNHIDACISVEIYIDCMRRPPWTTPFSGLR